MSTPTREEILEELTKTFASIDNGFILAIMYPKTVSTLIDLPEGMDTIQKIHKIVGPSVVKFISENQELWNQYCDFETLLQGLQKCNQ
tara:strand:+ start:639 stop:902 length:264 start_codon:yes stop_codon:yes gene_type:complete